MRGYTATRLRAMATGAIVVGLSFIRQSYIANAGICNFMDLRGNSCIFMRVQFF